jgi:hypothetical protein
MSVEEFKKKIDISDIGTLSEEDAKNKLANAAKIIKDSNNKLKRTTLSAEKNRNKKKKIEDFKINDEVLILVPQKYRKNGALYSKKGKIVKALPKYSGYEITFLETGGYLKNQLPGKNKKSKKK